jgi:hypothetical protein
MNVFRTLSAALALACGGPVWAQGAAPVANDTVVLRAGEFSLSRADYEKLVLGFERAAGAVTTGADTQSVQSGQEVARLLALVSEAKARKLDQTPAMQALMQVRAYVLLSNTLLKALTDEVKADEAGTRALWASEKNTYVDVVSRHILLRFKGAAVDGSDNTGTQRSEAQAKALAVAAYQKLKAGADFAALAKAASDELNTRSGGGALPPFTRGAMLAEFETAAFAATPGQVSEPFKTKYGWHVLLVDERRPFAFERVRPTLEFIRAKQKLEAVAASGTVLNDAYFKR